MAQLFRMKRSGLLLAPLPFTVWSLLKGFHNLEPQVLCVCDSHLLYQRDVDFVTEHKVVEGSTLVWSGVNTCYGPPSARKRKGI